FAMEHQSVTLLPRQTHDPTRSRRARDGVKRAPLFDTEAAMCAAFSEWAQGQGWTPYAETAGFDILLVHGDGTQIGVQAKLRFNTAVLAQILSGTDWGWT